MLFPCYVSRSFTFRIARVRNCGQRRRYHVQLDVIDDLKSRGLIADITRPIQLREEIESKSQSIYVGIDPTAKSLHVGHLLPLLCLFHFQLRGHQIIPLIGGATGLIGDPSGRSTERPLSERTKIEYNVSQLTLGVTRFFERALRYAYRRLDCSMFEILPPTVQNNLQWLESLNLLEFLRTVGFHSRVNTMIARESVQARLASQQGISFTEFTYQLLQAYDFFTLHKHLGCTIQVGGSDQWGNIIAGIELINRVNAGLGVDEAKIEKGFGITTPLLTTASGEKFGKSAGNAVSLNEQETSVFEFDSIRTPDADVGRYLKMFTLLPPSKIDSVIESHAKSPEARSAQRLLAQEITELVHDEDGVRRAETATKILYERDFATAKADDVVVALNGNPVLHRLEVSEAIDIPITKLAVKCHLAPSNNAARQLASAKGLYVNNHPVADVNQKLVPADLIDGRLVILRAGSQKVAVVALD
ncbi:Tyrosine--tRNA ligase, mitochondrial [Grifola frondosa]|uniref:Tyrosine--tRNA ligase n=1 Tax=Grifola frondosa TaxID=5627 RepID=A0A1C7LSW3_GRIFR|nr:Tyrosine--tRNA ligase, mitochondrial [Grifola frondosa]